MKGFLVKKRSFEKPFLKKESVNSEIKEVKAMILIHAAKSSLELQTLI